MRAPPSPIVSTAQPVVCDFGPECQQSGAAGHATRAPAVRDWDGQMLHETPFVDDPEAALERALMEEYLSEQGYSFQYLASLDDEDRQCLMLDAAAYAALRLAERAYPGSG
jgi:hypothetical protein